jgi:hypothetical protein
MHYVGVTSARFVYIEGKHSSLIAKYPTVRQDVAMLWAIVLSVLFLLGEYVFIYKYDIMYDVHVYIHMFTYMYLYI